VVLTPGATSGMTVGAQVPQPQPALLGTAGVGTKVHRGVNFTGAPVGRRHGVRRHRRAWLGMCGLVLTQGTAGFLRQTCKRFGLFGALAWWRGRQGCWVASWSAALGPGQVEHKTQPHQAHQ
jgi:hypothetical protein